MLIFREEQAMIVSAPIISKDSWLNHSDYAWFRDGYEYASTQNRAIPGLAAVSPEQLYHTVL